MCTAIVQLDAAAAAAAPPVLRARVAHNSLRLVCRTVAQVRAPPKRGLGAARSPAVEAAGQPEWSSTAAARSRR